MNKLQKIVLIMLLIPNLAMAESYLCIAEATGGIKFDKITGKPLGTSFKPTKKYIIKKKYSEWQVKDFGDQSIVGYRCKAETTVISCKTIIGSFVIKTDDLKYMRYDLFGWSGTQVIEGKKYSGTPHIEVGSCSEI